MKFGSTQPTTGRPRFLDTAIEIWPQEPSTEFGETWASAGRTLTGHSNRWEVGEMPDEIIEELWGIKDSIAREHGNDVRKLAAYLQGGELRNHSSGAAGRSAVDHSG